MPISFRWTIRIQRTLSGPPITGRITVVRSQHAYFLRSYLKEFRLFVLTPIEDAQTRRNLKADYYLKDLSQRHPMYCLDEDPMELGIEAGGEVVGSKESGRYCFEDPETLPKP
jgi:hypothetical protein